MYTTCFESSILGHDFDFVPARNNFLQIQTPVELVEYTSDVFVRSFHIVFNAIHFNYSFIRIVVCRFALDFLHITHHHIFAVTFFAARFVVWDFLNNLSRCQSQGMQ
uniref:Uncharacterized protein n=1 Tax=Cacopsylla melanoneura TaxID=428564 RepID=A0A8D8Q5L1_9HEMI